MSDDLDKYRVFARRALHLAAREIADSPGALPLTPSWLSYFLLYRAGVPAAVIAELIDAPRANIACRLLTVMEMMRIPEVWLCVELLVEEMGRVVFDAPECDIFPGPARHTAEGEDTA
jgi:hypothetical protein